MTRQKMKGDLTRLLFILATVAALFVLEVAEGALPNRSSKSPGLPSLSNPGICKAPSKPKAAVGLKGYRRFHAKDSFIGKPISCTRDDKVCFRYNLVFDPATDRCQPIGGGGRTGCDLRINRKEFKNGSGRAVGACKEYEDPCPGYRMAYDNRCYRTEVVRDVICGCGALPTRYIFGNAECRTSKPKPINVQQPKQEGRCLIPDLRFPDIDRSAFYKNPLTKVQGFDPQKSGISFKHESPHLQCGPEQARCFSSGTVWISRQNGCYRLLQRGPCAADQVVAMDPKAALKGRAEAICTHVRGGCPRGEKRMAFDANCHPDRDLQIASPVDVFQNQFAQFIMMPLGFSVSFHPRTLATSVCQVHITGVGSPGIDVGFPKPTCGSNNKGRCELFEVQSEPPMPE